MINEIMIGKNNTEAAITDCFKIVFCFLFLFFFDHFLIG